MLAPPWAHSVILTLLPLFANLAAVDNDNALDKLELANSVPNKVLARLLYPPRLRLAPGHDLLDQFWLE